MKELRQEANGERGIDITPLVRTRLEKAAADCGFELSPELSDSGLVLRSAQFPESVIVQPRGNDSFALSASVTTLLPESEQTLGNFKVQGWNALYEVLEKAAATARTMPNRVAQKFHQATAVLPKSTEAERWMLQRVGQNLFRSALLDYWQRRCCVTGLAVPELLRASHIRPWAVCGSDEQRLDIFNGLLLSPALDALFDGGWITFLTTGAMVVAESLPSAQFELMGVGVDLCIRGLKTEHRPYIEFHQQHVFRGALASA